MGPGLIVLACTTVLVDRGPVVAKSYDWHRGDGLVVVNKRGVAKRAQIEPSNGTPAEWTSRHASVTFNQYGRENPAGGMNDAGLVVEVMWLDETALAPRDGRPTVGVLQWIQLQLDLYASVDEVAAHAADTRIASDVARVHYLACDRSKVCVAVEVLDGKTVVTRGVRALTNDPYARTRAFAAEHEGRPPPEGRGSLARFARAQALAAAPPRGDAVTAAFAILDAVSQGPSSQWNIVYEPARGRVSWRTAASRTIKSLSLAAVEPSCATPVLLLDIDEPRGGDVASRLEPYRRERNRRLVDRVIDDFPHGPDDAARVADYPETTRCELSARAP